MQEFRQRQVVARLASEWEFECAPDTVRDGDTDETARIVSHRGY